MKHQAKMLGDVSHLDTHRKNERRSTGCPELSLTHLSHLFLFKQRNKRSGRKMIFSQFHFRIFQYNTIHSWTHTQNACILVRACVRTLAHEYEWFYNNDENAICMKWNSIGFVLLLRSFCVLFKFIDFCVLKRLVSYFSQSNLLKIFSYFLSMMFHSSS